MEKLFFCCFHTFKFLLMRALTHNRYIRFHRQPSSCSDDFDADEARSSGWSTADAAVHTLFIIHPIRYMLRSIFFFFGEFPMSTFNVITRRSVPLVAFEAIDVVRSEHLKSTCDHLNDG